MGEGVRPSVAVRGGPAIVGGVLHSVIQCVDVKLQGMHSTRACRSSAGKRGSGFDRGDFLLWHSASEWTRLNHLMV